MRAGYITEQQLLKSMAKALNVEDAAGWTTGQAILDDLYKHTRPEPPRDYRHMRPQCYRNRVAQSLVKVVPWYQPLDNESRMDYRGLIQEVEPDLFTSDVMANFECYSGLVTKMGYLIENENRVWIGLNMTTREFDETFEHLGDWNEELHRKVKMKPISPKSKRRKKL